MSHNGQVGEGFGRPRLRISLATQLVVVQLILIAAVLVAVSAVSVEQTRISFQRDQGQRVLALAEVLAASATVRAGLTEGTDSLLPAATTQLQATTGIGLVMVAGVDGVVLASSDPLLVDEQLAWPELVAAPIAPRRAPSSSAGRATWWPPPRCCPIRNHR